MAAAQALMPVILLLAAGLAALLAGRALGLSPIVGFLVVGALLGEHGFHLVEESDTTHLLAELGVVFLLFDIGLHFSLAQVRSARADLTSLAPMQFVLCAVPFAVIAKLLGCTWPLAVVLGCAFALSSTAVVARLLSERNLVSCPLGRSTTAVLIFQDIAAIFLLVFAQSLDAAGSDLAMAAGAAALKAILAAAAALIVGRLVAVPAFRALAATRNEEVFPAAALLIVLATAAATGALGLSLTLGAFLAGMIIADTPYRALIQTEVRPFRALLMGFFFMVVGMSIDVQALATPQALATVIGGAVALLALKTLLIVVAARSVGWSRPGAVQLGFILSQGSEFALVVFALPAVLLAAPAGVLDTLTAVIAVTLAATPAWSNLGMRLARAISRRAAASTSPAPAPAPSASPSPTGRPVIVFGLTPAGRLVTDAVRAQGAPVIAIESDPDRFAAAQADGYEPLLGDAGDMRFVETAGGKDAQMVVLGAGNFDRSQDLTAYLREAYPDLARFAAVSSADDAARYATIGVRAHLVTDADDTPGANLAADVLTALGVPREDAEAALTALAQAPRAA